MTHRPHIGCWIIVCALVLAATASCEEAPVGHVEGEHAEGEHADGEHAEGEHAEGEEVDHGDHASPKKIGFAKEAIARAGIEVAEVNVGNLQDNVRATAVVEHDIGRVAHIAPLVEGQVTDIRAMLGEEVAAGQTLAVMRSVALGEARAAIQEAEAALEVTRQNFARQEKLLQKGIASERAFIEARGELKQAEARYEAARARLRALGVSGGSGPTYPLKSRIDGTIIEQHASVGETKGPQDELFVVADDSEVWVIGQVPEQQAHAVRPGMKALVTLDAYPERTWEGQVDWIASTVDRKTRLLPIRVTLDNPERRLKPGMFGTIRLSQADAARTLVLVPVDSVQQLEGQPHVFVPGDHPGEFHAQPVVLGAEAGGLVEVLEGLSPDARIVARGAFDVKAALTAGGRSAAHAH